MQNTNRAFLQKLGHALHGLHHLCDLACGKCISFHSPLYYLVVSEIPHQSAVDVGVVGDATQDLGALEGSVWVGAAVAQIPAEGKTKILLDSICAWKLVLRV